MVNVTDIAVAADGDPVLAYTEFWIEDDLCMFPGAPPEEAHVTRLDAQAGYGVDPAFGDHDLGVGWVVVPRDLDVTPEGRLLLGGLATDGPMSLGTWAWVSRRDGTTGAADTGFGDADGMRRLPFDVDFAEAAAVEQAPDGSVLAATDLVDQVGCSPSCTFDSPGLAVTRLTAAGELDGTFGTGGTTVVDFGTPTQFAAALGLSGDRVVVAGSAGDQLAAARLRLTADPTLTPTPTPTPEPTGPQDPGPPGPPAPRPLRLRGTAAADLLLGGPLGDVLCGLGGADRLIGGDGGDRLHGDACTGAARRGDDGDRLEGGAGDDRLSGGRGADRLAGEEGADTLNGGKGQDRLDGGAGKDRLSGGGSDRLAGGPGADILRGGAGHDRYEAGAGNDVVKAVNGRRSVVRCGPGRDLALIDAHDRAVAANASTEPGEPIPTADTGACSAGRSGAA